MQYLNSHISLSPCISLWRLNLASWCCWYVWTHGKMHMKSKACLQTPPHYLTTGKNFQLSKFNAQLFHVLGGSLLERNTYLFIFFALQNTFILICSSVFLFPTGASCETWVRWNLAMTIGWCTTLGILAQLKLVSEEREKEEKKEKRIDVKLTHGVGTIMSVLVWFVSAFRNTFVAHREMCTLQFTINISRKAFGGVLYCNPGNFHERLIFVLFVTFWNLWKLIAY